jgi:predicted RNA-binding protein with PIN domain
MHYLIDGYNLLHAMGALHGRTGPAGLEKARLRLLGLLRGAYEADEARQVTVVFDAAGAPAGVPEIVEYKGIQVRFATRQAEADDLIETLIGHDSAPRRLMVISDDRRIQQAARRRRCQVAGCGEYLEWLEQHRRQRKRRPEPDPDKPATVSSAETQHWLEEFAEQPAALGLPHRLDLEDLAAEFQQESGKDI